MEKELDFDRPAGFIVSEGSGRHSREQIAIAAGSGDLKSGTALGKLTATGEYVPYNPAGADGSQNFGGILYERREDGAAAVRATAVVRDAEVNGNEIVFVNALTAPQLTAFEAAAAAANVLVRY